MGQSGVQFQNSLETQQWLAGHLRIWCTLRKRLVVPNAEKKLGWDYQFLVRKEQSGHCQIKYKRSNIILHFLQIMPERSQELALLIIRYWPPPIDQWLSFTMKNKSFSSYAHLSPDNYSPHLCAFVNCSLRELKLTFSLLVDLEKLLKDALWRTKSLRA